MKNKPVLVWLILTWYVISTGVSIISAWAIMSGAVNIPKERQEYFDHLGWLDYLATIAIAASNLGGAISLFALRKFAIMFFAVGFAINLTLTIYQSLGGYYTPEGISSYSRFIIPLLCIIYTAKMKKSGSLN